MKRILIVISIIVIATGLIFINYKQKSHNTNLSYSSSSLKTECICINKLIKVDWGNMGTYIMFYDPLNLDTPAALPYTNISEIEFGRPGNEEWAKGGKNTHFVDEFIEMVNQKCDYNIKALTYKGNTYSCELNYEDGSSIIWDSTLKKGVLKTP